MKPFVKASKLKKRLKLLLWGDLGTGKTTLALQFPKPVVIDMDGSTDLYGDKFDFDVLRANDPDEVMKAIDWLLSNKHDYSTLVIDPITIYWESLQKKWSEIFLKRNKGGKGHRFEFYDLQVRDWMTIKAEFKELIRKLIALDMNIIVTAREKVKYKDGGFMVADGETFDGEKSLPYEFDTVVRCYKNSKGVFMGMKVKDRNEKLPESFKLDYALFDDVFKDNNLARPAVTIEPISKDQTDWLTTHFKGAGCTVAQVKSRLMPYHAKTINDLTKDNAEILIGKIKEAAESAKEKDNAKS
jgi:hypothetical protein